MSLSFLSKKSFHVTNVRNVEKVWLAEQQEAEEQRKLEEWRKAREEERQKMELRELQEETGHAKKASERVDFLYEQPMTSASEYLLGKAVEVKPEESEVKRVEHLPGSTFLSGQNNLSSAANEEFNKMTNDPLVLMRMKEQEALKRILDNPLKLKQIRAAAAHRAEEPSVSKKHKHKKEKKHKKHRRKHARSRSRSASLSGSEQDSAHWADERSRRDARRSHRDDASGMRGQCAEGSKRKEDDLRRDRDRGRTSEIGRDRSPSREPRRDRRGRSRDKDCGRDRSRSRSRDAGRDRGRRSSSTDRERKIVSSRGLEVHQGYSVSGRPSDAQAPSTRPGYGLQVYRGGHKVESCETIQRSTAHVDHSCSSNRQPLPSAAPGLARTTSASPQPVQVPGRRRHVPLSAEERERRAREMASAAQAREAQRMAILEKPKEVAEDEEPLVDKAEHPSFLDGVARDVYANTSIDAISERINQSKHYMQRGSRASAEGFMRQS